MTMTSCTPVGHSADSPEAIFRPLPAISPDAEILDAGDPDFGYDTKNVPHQQTEREMRVICSARS
jgi:hypothetical protein